MFSVSAAVKYRAEDRVTLEETRSTDNVFTALSSTCKIPIFVSFHHVLSNKR